MRRVAFIVGLIVLAVLLTASQAAAGKQCARVTVSWTGEQPFGPASVWENQLTLRGRSHKLVGTGQWYPGLSTVTPNGIITAFGWGTWEFPGVGSLNMWSIGSVLPFNAEVTEFGWEGSSLIVGCGDFVQGALPKPPAGPELAYCTQGNGGMLEFAWGQIADFGMGAYDEVGQGTMSGSMEGKLCGVTWKDVPKRNE